MIDDGEIGHVDAAVRGDVDARRGDHDFIHRRGSATADERSRSADGQQVAAAIELAQSQRFRDEKIAVAIEGDVGQEIDRGGQRRAVLANDGRPDAGDGIEQTGRCIDTAHPTNGVV